MHGVLIFFHTVYIKVDFYWLIMSKNVYKACVQIILGATCIEQKNMAGRENSQLGMTLNKSIFLALSHLDKVKFAVLEIINCNATQSVSFSDVYCKFEIVKLEREILKHEVRSLNVNFSTLFKTGFDFINKCRGMTREDIEELNRNERKAITTLDEYFQNIGEVQDINIVMYGD